MGADPNLDDGRGWRPLHLAASSFNTKCVRLVLDAGCDVDTRNGVGQTALARSILVFNMEAARLLIAHGAKLELVECHVPNSLVRLAEGRERCRYVALLMVAFRKLHRSPVLAVNGLDVAKMLAKYVWSTRMETPWQDPAIY